MYEKIVFITFIGLQNTDEYTFGVNKQINSLNLQIFLPI